MTRNQTDLLIDLAAVAAGGVAAALLNHFLIDCGVNATAAIGATAAVGAIGVATLSGRGQLAAGGAAASSAAQLSLLWMSAADKRSKQVPDTAE